MLLEGLPTPMPLADTLPALLREDAFARGVCGGIDELLAPVLLSLDGYSAYLDLSVAPEDMLGWLAQWVGLSVDPGQELSRQRELLRSSGELHALRGTRRGIELAVHAALGLTVEVVETGGSTWSAQAGGELPGEPTPAIVVIARSEGGVPVDVERLDALVASVKPAHVQHRVQVV
jgi:phage tail-like protein